MKGQMTAVALLLLLWGLVARVPHLRVSAGDEPVGTSAGALAGVHTIRADDELLRLVTERGFSWVVQLLEWREVEPTPEDRFWEYADWLVRATEYYGLDLVLRLDHPPEWSTSPDGLIPIDVAAYASFVGRVADRYQGRVEAYIIWNEPNLALEWQGQAPDPAGYVELLCAAHAAIGAVDPEAGVVSAGLAPTNHNDDQAVDDRLYLQAMYAAGAGDCFDVLGAHPYGFAYAPDDAHGAHDGLNFARLADLREIMVEAGDGDKWVWATELGWTTAPVGVEQQWLGVSEEEQADYLVGAFEQAGQEWPWLERIAVWNLSQGLSDDDEKKGYSILGDGGVPKLAYESLLAVTRGQRSEGDEGMEAGPWPDHHRLPSDTVLRDTASEAVLRRCGSGTLQDRPAEVQTMEILAPDVVVRLSDVDTFHPHWARPHCGSVPCRQWSGQFYVYEPEAGPWRLCLETMQVEEPGNLIWINGHLLDPPAIPLRGRPNFASLWTGSEVPVPSSVLRSGANRIEIGSSPRLPVFQDDHAHFESLQFRHVRLVSDF